MSSYAVLTSVHILEWQFTLFCVHTGLFKYFSVFVCMTVCMYMCVIILCALLAFMSAVRRRSQTAQSSNQADSRWPHPLTSTG